MPHRKACRYRLLVQLKQKSLSELGGAWLIDRKPRVCRDGRRPMVVTRNMGVWMSRKGN